MKLESAISSINRILRSTVKIFGINSSEYMKMKYLVESTDENIDLFIREAKGEPIGIKRSKTALKGLEKMQKELEETLNVMRNEGSMLQMAKKYDQTMTAKRLSSPIERKRIHKKAMQRAAQSYMIPDWYDAINDIGDPKLQAQARLEFGKVKGHKGQEAKDIRGEAIEYVRQCLLDEATMLKKLNVDKSRGIGRDVTLAEALENQK